MQVKKFEAKSIKEAIGLVKLHMGPDAIILSAKENVKRFGLMGETSVEVTAAVSENKLHSKRIAERKLNSKAREKYLQATAKQQKEFIAKAIAPSQFDFDEGENESGDEAVMAAPPPPPPVPKENGITSVRYADIDESGFVEAGDEAQIYLSVPANKTPIAAKAVAPAKASAPASAVAKNVRPATVQTIKATSVTATSAALSSAAPNSALHAAPAAVPGSVENLQNEVQYLRGLLNNFQKMPTGFVSMHPGAEDGLPYELSFAFKRLADAGISHENTVEILKFANERLPAEQKKKKAFVDGWVIKYMLEQLQIADKPMRAKFHMFLGPTGQGKTSTVIKLACHLIMKEKKRVALVTGDVIKVGATDQFKIYAQILNAPYAVVTKLEDWNTLAPQLANLDYVLFDTPGLNLKAGSDLEVLRRILPPGLAKNPDDFQTHFVQSIMARDTDAFEIAERFKFVGFQDVIFTRLDEAVQFGLIYNFQRQFKTPLHSFGIGNNIPEDFEFASKERVIDLLFNLSQFRKERG